MTTVQKLFVQIFDRKKWIEDQLKQQRYLYDQYLASTLLINGIRPPSWLLSSGFEGGSADLKELKKEELISGLLFPPPRAIIPSNVVRNTLYKRSSVTENNAQQSDDLIPETCASNKYSDVGARSTLVSKCEIKNSEHGVGCTLDGVPELDHTIASPQGQTDARRDEEFEPDQSLAKIKRSRSRQKALEIRNSGKSETRSRQSEDCTRASSDRLTRSRTAGQPTCGKELLELQSFSDTTNGSGERVTRSRFAAQKLDSDKPLQLQNSVNGKGNTIVAQDLVQSSSLQNNLELHNFVVANTEDHPDKEDNVDHCRGIITMSETTHLQINCNEGLLKPENSSKIPSCQVTRSRSTSSHKLSQASNPSNRDEGQSLLKADNSSKIPSYRVTRSRSTSSNKFSQASYPSNQGKDHDFLKASDAQPITVPCHDSSVTAHPEIYSTVAAQTDRVSEVPLEVCSYQSISNNLPSRGIEKGVLTSSPLADNNIYVEPKKLLFDEVEDCNLNVCSSPASEKETGYGFLEMRVTPVEHTKSVRKVIVSGDLHKKHCPPVDPQLLEKDQDLKSVNREEHCRASSDAHNDRHGSVRTVKSDSDFHLSCTGKTSNLSVMSSREKAQSSEHVVVDRRSSMRREKSDSGFHPPYMGEILNSSVMSSREKTWSSEHVVADGRSSVRTEKSDSAVLPPCMVKNSNLSVMSSREEGQSSEHPVADRRNSVRTEKSDSDFYTQCTGKTSNLSAMSSRKEAQSSEHIGAATSPEGNNISKKLVSTKKLVSSGNVQEKTGLAVDLEILEDQSMDAVNSEERRALSVSEEEKLEFVEEKSNCHLHPVFCTGKIWNASSRSKRKGTPEVYENVESDMFLGSNKISKLATVPSDSLSAMQVPKKSSSASPLEGEVDTKLSDLDMESHKVSLGDACTLKLDLNPDKILHEGCKLDGDECDSYEKQMSPVTNCVADFPLPKNPDPIFVTDFSLPKNNGISDGDQETECAAARDAAMLSVQEHSITPKPVQMNSTTQEAPYVLRSYNSFEKNKGCSRFSNSCFAKKNTASTKMIHDATENSWPAYKRRKIEVQSSTVINTFPKLGRAKPPHQLDENNQNRFFKNVKDGSGSDLQLQHISSCSDVEVAHSNVFEGPDEEIYRSAKRCKTEIYGFSSGLLAKEGDREIEAGYQHSSTSIRVKELLGDQEIEPEYQQTSTPLGVTESLGDRDIVAEYQHTITHLEVKESLVEGSLLSTGEEYKHTSTPLGVREVLVNGSLISIVEEEANENSQHHLKEKVADPIGRQFVSEDDQNSRSPKSELNLGRMEEVSTEEALQERKSDIGNLLFPYCSVGYTHEDHILSDVDKSMPEFEGFRIGVPAENILSSLADNNICIDKLDLPGTSNERISVLEQLCRSTSMLTPLSQSKYKLHKTPDIYQSLPNGLLENMGLKNTVFFSEDEIKQLKAGYSLMSAEFDQASYSDSMTSSNVDWGVRKPPTPPIRKFCPRVTSVPSIHSSEQQHSVNPELTCFRIDEDASTSDGNGNMNEEFNVVEERFSPRNDNSSTIRDPFVEMTNTNLSASVSVSESFHDRGSLASVNTELNVHRAQTGANKQQKGNDFPKNRSAKNKEKENHCSSIGANSVGKSSESLYNRLNRQTRSSKASAKKENQSLFDKSYKSTNIVSNVSSFIPLVQQKNQPAAPITGKRGDIKVKSLEAAEAVKRLQEKRENDRKMRHEAAKVERARLEKEKSKQWELQQKQKEQGRRKIEVDMVAKKRQREDEERKEKVKKRKCLEEARRHGKEDKMHAGKDDKEQRCRAVDEREGKRKEQQPEAKKHQKPENEWEIAECRKATENMTAEASDHEVAEDSQLSPDKVERNLSMASYFSFPFIEESGVNSYEISPYAPSEDEDEGEEGVPLHKKRSIPSWAREENLVAVLPAMQKVDPRRFFPPRSFCGVSEVLLLPQMNPK